MFTLLFLVLDSSIKTVAQCTDDQTYVNAFCALDVSKCSPGIDYCLFSPAAFTCDVDHKIVAHHYQTSGGIPTQIGCLQKLELLEMRITNDDMSPFTLPAQIGQLKALTRLDIQQRSGSMSRPQFDGSIPSQFGLMTNLEELIITSVDITSNIPEETGSLTKLRVFILTGTPIEGSLPTTMALLTNLENLQLIDNSLTGTLPDIFDRFTSLSRLTIQSNTVMEQFTGTLPPTIFEHLDSSDSFVIDASGLGGLIPDIPADKIITGFIIELRGAFVDPLPQFLLDVIGNGNPGLCDLSGNKFCHIPVPYTTSMATTVCDFQIATEPDICGVCEGNGDTCDDCRGTAAGSETYDECDVCGGSGSSCLDCRGTHNGPATYDECDVCDGDNLSCQDCNHVSMGTSKHDACGVCDGDGSSCLDCAGIPYGTLQYDVCHVCGGDGVSCKDCAGVFGGKKIVDECGDCVNILSKHYQPSCYDCEGVPFGTTKRDMCGGCPADNHHCDFEFRFTMAIIQQCSHWLWLVSAAALVIATTLLCYVGYRRYGSAR